MSASLRQACGRCILGIGHDLLENKARERILGSRNKFLCHSKSMQTYAVLNKKYFCTEDPVKQKPSDYDVLGIRYGSSQEEIKEAFLKLSKQYHPDKNSGNKEAHDEYLKLQEAYNRLAFIEVDGVVRKKTASEAMELTADEKNYIRKGFVDEFELQRICQKSINFTMKFGLITAILSTAIFFLYGFRMRERIAVLEDEAYDRWKERDRIVEEWEKKLAPYKDLMTEKDKKRRF